MFSHDDLLQSVFRYYCWCCSNGTAGSFLPFPCLNRNSLLQWSADFSFFFTNTTSASMSYVTLLMHFILFHWLLVSVSRILGYLLYLLKGETDDADEVYTKMPLQAYFKLWIWLWFPLALILLSLSEADDTRAIFRAMFQSTVVMVYFHEFSRKIFSVEFQLCR